MPFEEPWDDYTPDDLLYGLVDNRAGLARHMGIKVTDIYTIDQYDILADAPPVQSVKNPLKHDRDFWHCLSQEPRHGQS